MSLLFMGRIVVGARTEAGLNFARLGVSRKNSHTIVYVFFIVFYVFFFPFVIEKMSMACTQFEPSIISSNSC